MIFDALYERYLINRLFAAMRAKTFTSQDYGYDENLLALRIEKVESWFRRSGKRMPIEVQELVYTARKIRAGQYSP